MKLTVVICTHNRVALLQQALASLNAAARPAGSDVEILVVANACTDSTHAFLQGYANDARNTGGLPLRWIKEPKLGKSHALNRAIHLPTGDIIAFVDDDHRVDTQYLGRACETVLKYANATLFCGRLLPDWDGSEPVWAHDTGPYRIYPLPVPLFDQGDTPKEIAPGGAIPQGGNLCVRRGVFNRIGGFSPRLGPQGHNLIGGEDRDFVRRALAAGERLIYSPDVVQYHHVDKDRFRVGYLMRKAYQRTRSVVHLQEAGGIPLYAWRKLATYAFHVLFSLNWPKRRFYMVRMAAALGEIKGFMQVQCDRRSRPATMGKE